MAYQTRGIRNKNPFNIRFSNNSWLGKISKNSDKDFECFSSMDYGLRAGFLLLRNGYLAKGYVTVPGIIAKYAPSCENDVNAYCNFIYEHSPLRFDTVINLQSLSFFHLCRCICKFESDFDLDYDRFRSVINKFNLGF